MFNTKTHIYQHVFLFNRILATSVFGQCKVITIQLTEFDEYYSNFIGWSNKILFIYYRYNHIVEYCR